VLFAGNLTRSEAVADGCRGAANVVGIELRVVGNYIKVDFGTQKEASPEIVADAAADVGHEVIGVDVSGAGKIRGVADAEMVVENYGFKAHAGHKLGFGFFARGNHVEGVRVGENGTEILIAVVETLLGSDRDFQVDAQAVVLLEQNIAGEGGI